MSDKSTLEEQQKKLGETESQLGEQQERLKKLRNMSILRIVLNVLLTAAFVVICTFSVYRRYDEKQVFDKPTQTDEGQQKIDDSTPQKDDNQQKTPDQTTAALKPDQNSESPTQPTTQPSDNNGTGHFTIYSNGDVYTADNGSGKAHCDVRNTEISLSCK